MSSVAPKSLTFAGLVGLTVTAFDTALTMDAGVFEPWAAKTVVGQLVTGLSVAGWSLIGAVPGLSLASRQGRHPGWRRTAIFAVALGLIGCGLARLGTRVFGEPWALLLGYDGIAWIEVTLLLFIVWWAVSSFAATLWMARKAVSSGSSNP